MIEINAKQLENAIKAMGKFADQLPKAMSIAINRGIRAGRTEMSKQVRAKFRIKQGDLYSALQMDFAGGGDSPAGRLGAVHAGMLPTWDFHVAPRSITNPSMSGRTRRKRGGRGRAVTTAVRVGGGGVVPVAFVAQMKSGHLGVFYRQGPSRLPIAEMHSISAPFMISPEDVRDPIERKIQETFDKELERQVARLAG